MIWSEHCFSNNTFLFKLFNGKYHINNFCSVSLFGILWCMCAHSNSLKIYILFSRRSKFLICQIPCGFYWDFSELYPECTLSETLLLAPGFVTMWVFMGVEKYCESSSILTSLSNIIMMCGHDYSLFWIIFTGEAFYPTVVNCSAVLMEWGGTKTFVFGDV